MIVLMGRNVNDLWREGMMTLNTFGVKQDSRAGRVLVAPWPVMSVYENPRERVLMDPVRDANPFFHLMESLWMLAGRDDAAFLDRYVGDFGKRYGDGPEENRVIHGAYGLRWRKGFGRDQLEYVVQKLRANPNDRQCVIQMWDANENEGFDDLRGEWKDRPCNTHVYLRVRSETLRDYGGGPPGPGPASRNVLDLTVCCRSNDIVFGAYGANAVHFSVLQEYLAGRIGVAIGKMYQFSNNYHGYEDVLARQGDPMLMRPDRFYEDGQRSIPMGVNWEKWDEDLARFMTWHDARLWAGEFETRVVDYEIYVNSWFAHTAMPLAVANWLWKRGGDYRHAALAWAERIDAPDWRAACTAWIKRRMK